MNSTTHLIEQMIAPARRHLRQGLVELEAGAEPLTILPRLRHARRSLAELERAIRRQERTRVMQQARELLAHATTDSERASIMALAIQCVLATMTPDERVALLRSVNDGEQT